MKARLLLPVLLLLAALLPPCALQAQDPSVPVFLNYQGTVTDANGLPLGSTGTPAAPVAAPENRKVLFRIYSTATGGTSLWTEQQTVTISLGQFSVLLGNGIDPTGTAAGEAHGPLADVFTDAAGGSAEGPIRYLELTVDDGNDTIGAEDKKISPRQRITTTAYSFVANSVVDGGISNAALAPLAVTTDKISGSAVGSPQIGDLSILGGDIAANTITADKLDLGTVGLWGVSGGNVYRSSGNVGIGTTTPAERLHIQSASDPAILIGNTASGEGAIYFGNTSHGIERNFNGVANDVGLFTNSGNLYLSANGPLTNKFVLNSAGNVGIGQTNPGFNLHLSDLFGEKLCLNGVAGGSIYGFGIQAATLQTISQGDITFGSGTSAALNEKMRITSAGNVGIGTATPGAKLHVDNGRIRVSDTTGVIEVASDAGGANAIFTDPTGDLFIRTDVASEDLILQNFSSGNVGIGTATPAQKLDVAGNATVSGTISGNDIQIYEANGNPGTPTTGTLVLRHGNHGGASSIVFPSARNYGGDFGFIQFRDTATIDGPNEANKLIIGTTDGADDDVILLPTGNVGIGTMDPRKAKLVVSGAGPAMAAEFFRAFAAAHPLQTSTLPWTAGIYASSNIATGNTFLATSDARIKTINGRSDSLRDLETLMKVEVTDYTFKDTVGKGDRAFKKVIAQQVEEVFSQAVSASTDVVPDIYATAAAKDGWVELATDLKQGELVRLIGEREDGIHEVLEVRDGGFRTAFKPATEKVFVYGREVNDFRSVDYDAISMLNVSATQELARRLESRDAELTQLREENEAMAKKLAALEAKDEARDAKFAALEAKDQARDAKLAAIEAMLRSAGEPAVRKVSLKTAGVE